MNKKMNKQVIIQASSEPVRHKKGERDRREQLLQCVLGQQLGAELSYVPAVGSRVRAAAGKKSLTCPLPLRLPLS